MSVVFLRDGQWCRFTPLFHLDGAFHACDGRAVGIFQAPFKGDANASAHSMRIAVVAPNGENLVVVIDGQRADCILTPEHVQDLEPVVDRRDIPLARIAHLPGDWQPKP